MLSATQQQLLETIVQGVSDALHIEAARLDQEQTLELVLCRESICFRPLRIRQQDVDITAALAGQAAAQRTLQAWLREALRGML
jgi:hypothetical protein